MNGKLIKTTLLSLCFLFLSFDKSQAEIKEKDSFFSTFSLCFENDTFFGTDRDYTNGLRLSYASDKVPFSSPEFNEKINRQIDKVPLVGSNDSKRFFALSLNQNIYTPEDTTNRELVCEERPYAGLSYLSFAILKQKNSSLSSWEIGCGLVGRYSLAEKTQRVIHEWHGWDQPKGWRHQLNNEPVAQIFYNRKWLISGPKNFMELGLDLIPRIEWGLGNALDYIGTGMEIRFGWRLPKDYGNGYIRPIAETHLPVDKQDPRFNNFWESLGFHVFAGSSAAFIARNILLDGNSFRSSHKVDKELWIGSLSWGIGLNISNFKVIYAHVYKSREYKAQKEAQSYGTVSISYTW